MNLRSDKVNLSQETGIDFSEKDRCDAIVAEFQISSKRIDKLVTDLRYEKVKIYDFLRDKNKNKYGAMHARTIQREISISLENLLRLNNELSMMIKEQVT